MHGTSQRTIKCNAGRGRGKTNKLLEDVKQPFCAVTWMFLTML